MFKKYVEGMIESALYDEFGQFKGSVNKVNFEKNCRHETTIYFTVDTIWEGYSIYGYCDYTGVHFIDCEEHEFLKKNGYSYIK